jgi:hypothetical protein
LINQSLISKKFNSSEKTKRAFIGGWKNTNHDDCTETSRRRPAQGIFKDLPSFWWAPLQLPLLEWQLKICPMNRSSATYLPVLASCLSMSACHGGSATGKDIPAPTLLCYPIPTLMRQLRRLSRQPRWSDALQFGTATISH